MKQYQIAHIFQGGATLDTSRIIEAPTPEEALVQAFSPGNPEFFWLATWDGIKRAYLNRAVKDYYIALEVKIA